MTGFYIEKELVSGRKDIWNDYAVNTAKCYKKINQVKEFGLVDPDDKEGKKPAFVSYDKTTDKWNAKVECNNRTDTLRYRK